MNRQEALKILDLHDDAQPEDIRQAYEDLVFPHVAFFIQRPVIPKVFLKKLQQIEVFWEALLLLTSPDVQPVKEPSALLTMSDFSFEILENELSVVKLLLSNTLQYPHIRAGVERLLALHGQYEAYMLGQFEWFTADPSAWVDYFDPSVLISNVPPYHQVRSALRQLPEKPDKESGQWRAVLTETWRIIKQQDLKS